MLAGAERVNGSAAPTDGRISKVIPLFLVRGVSNFIFTVPCFWPLNVGSGASFAAGSVKVKVLVESALE